MNKQYILMACQLRLALMDANYHRTIAPYVFIQICQIPDEEFAGNLSAVWDRMVDYINYEYGPDHADRPAWVKPEWFRR